MKVVPLPSEDISSLYLRESHQKRNIIKAAVVKRLYLKVTAYAFRRQKPMDAGKVGNYSFSSLIC